MDPEQAKAALEAAANSVGRAVRVFMRAAALEEESPTSQTANESEEFYEFTSADYARLLSYKKEDNILKTKYIRDAELAARRAKIVKAVVRVQFPDNVILEADFSSSDSVVLLVELLKKVLVHPELPFTLYTAPPKQQLKNFQLTMYEAGLAPGGLVYFAYTNSKDVAAYLKPEIANLRDLHRLLPATALTAEPVEVAKEIAAGDHPTTSDQRPRAAKSNSTKPKWLRLNK